jgi:hypothetical protein
LLALEIAKNCTHVLAYIESRSCIEKHLQAVQVLVEQVPMWGWFQGLVQVPSALGWCDHNYTQQLNGKPLKFFFCCMNRHFSLQSCNWARNLY